MVKVSTADNRESLLDNIHTIQYKCWALMGPTSSVGYPDPDGFTTMRMVIKDE